MLAKEDIQGIIETIKENVNPKQIYLFGSYASGTPTESSDLDILIIDDSGKAKNKLALEISKALFPRNFGLDLIVASSAEIKEKQKQNLSFWNNILNRGKKLYERN
ncbi:hypothetical protein A2526_00205 [candidate division WOR-1 bacterium RIFOXYD2_FULL_36_8]|uniref:Polymerase beta nucleotidyltransferase domain-containing protein n=1 Tax=candidate division WOR-1 bacterium RIFOXYB2_FULL_36_35 TaxID=1802578 RepID=A0A1F4S485_UNCSA|nr:MAG: hypothetical protein A2230_00905 [candidate division WOR-1 bacterium RIFOXYA2_FULL_36_21]OGC14241.1 MAG: hypothetical protein A2282_06620 [candidate division WOR-1 bacterium RIFOXYA12_FULL_36_13]OGC15246.1 MAG: hypothetical protein A2290_03115 [candidate division WOR-1 bacterium RIFOXYB2_FULL_36_35]OGC38257.1 MAG: hypothetical protein A2526_00205 [candidate division WOR-1 bacterium RIFOXYD2_FULL_36_8]